MGFAPREVGWTREKLNLLGTSENQLRSGPVVWRLAATCFDGTNVHFTFGIPRGNDGATGAQGPPGEVTQSDLNNAVQNTLAQTSSNSNAVSTLSQSADAGYSPTQMQDVLSKIDELINALRR